MHEMIAYGAKNEYISIKLRIICLHYTDTDSDSHQLNAVACRAVAMQRSRDGRIYWGRFWATAR
jgi:hypothetical protein